LVCGTDRFFKEAEMESQNLDRIRFVTRHFNDLQGLRYLVPLGLVTLSVGGTVHFAGWPLFLLGPIAGGAFLLMFFARRHYEHSFGAVEAGPAYPAGELHGLSIYSPAGPAPRLEGFQQVTPIARHFLMTMALVLSLFAIFELIPPNILIVGGESTGQHPQIQAQTAPLYESYMIWVNAFGSFFKSPRAFLAICGQMTYVLFASIFLGVWLWRERRRSQSYHLTLAVLLMGLAILGASLGFFARDAARAPIVDFLLPALIYPGVALLLCGAAMTLAGLIDHWQLVRVFKPAMEEES
jgi:hypothetical protein